MKKIFLSFILIISISLLFVTSDSVFAQDKAEADRLFKIATEHIAKGNYKEAIENFDRVLVLYPDHAQTLKMKAVAESNLGYHEKSLLNFYKVLQKDPNDVLALTGLGVGFGNFAEYREAKMYFEKALEFAPSNTVVRNYNEYADKVIAKYPYKPTEKPESITPSKQVQVPSWIKNNAKWWSEGQIGDSDFVNGIEYLMVKGVIVISDLPQAKTSSKNIPEWVKNNARWWANDQITQNDFVSGIQFLVENGIIVVDKVQDLQMSEQERAADFQLFNTYVKKVTQAVANEKRYIEYPNPSEDVIKKFLRDYIKWNFDQQVQAGNTSFPDPTYEIVNDVYVIEYKLFVNEQPSGLPLDHVSTLDHSLAYWESQNFTTNGNPVKVKFTYTKTKSDATVWITWVIRNLGEGVLGHANLGKGIAEIVLGDYGCDGSFQLYDVDTVEKIMRHELGHTVGLGHSSDPNNIMYTSLKPKYAYCLLS